jgi:hypothetical protein
MTTAKSGYVGGKIRICQLSHKEVEDIFSRVTVRKMGLKKPKLIIKRETGDRGNLPC